MKEVAEMTQDPFAPSESRPSVSFKNAPVGTTYHLEVTGLPSLVQARNFETRELEAWPDGNPKMTVVTNVVNKQTGEEQSLWAPKPSSMFQAIVDAQAAAGAQIQIGGTLTVSFTHEVPNKDNPRLNPAKQYAVKYEPPNAFGGAPEWAQPAQQAAPIQQQQAPVPPPYTPPVAPPVQQQLPVAPPVQQASPQQQAAPAPAPAYTHEAIAALLAAGVDPRGVYPTYAGEYGWPANLTTQA